MRPRALLAACLIALSSPSLGGCAAAAPVARVAAPPEDDAVALAAMLPAGAERCVVARPGLVPDRRRALVLRATGGEILAWSSSPRVAAYATARAVTPDGRLARITVVRLAEPLAGAREALRDALPLRVRFEDEPCHADECDLPVAEVLDARTVRIARGVPARATSTAGGSQCLDLAIAHPDAIELAVDQASCGDAERTEGTCVERRIVSVGPEGLRVRQQLLLGDEARAAELAAAFARVDDGATRVERRGATLVRTSEQSWDALQLSLEDERIEREAIARRQAARRSMPIDRVDVSRMEVVRQQVRLREDALARARGDVGRRARAAELASLLGRAIQAHPEESELAARLVRLLLDELGDPEGALAIARGMAARGQGDAAWALLLRECLVAAHRQAPSGEVMLAEAARALVEASVADDEASARAAVRDLAAITTAGIPYELAESTWAHAREVVSEPIALSPAPRGSGLPLAALPATLVWLAELEGISGPFSTSIAVRGRAADVVRAQRVDRMADAVVVRMDALPGGPVFAGHAASNDALLRLGASLESAIAPGPVTIDVTLMSLGGASRVRARLAGELANGRVRIERADATGAARPWARIERYLAEPLHGLGARLFPPPDLVVVASDPEDAAQLARVADGEGDAHCAARGVEVRCAPRADVAPFEALRAIARVALVPVATAPVERHR